MEPTNRTRPSLPPIHFFESDKYKREDVDYQHRHIDVTSASMASTAATSPTYQHPTGPPPPYSNLPPAVNAHSHVLPPRNQPTEENESGKQQVKQSLPSLPSLHEALGVEQPMPNSSEAAYSTAPHSSHTATVQSSPSIHPRHSFGMEHSTGPVNPYSHPQSTSYTPHKAPSLYTDSDRIEKRKSEFAEPVTYHRPSLQTSASTHSPIIAPSQRPLSHTFASSDPYDNAPQAPARPATKSFSYGYAPYPPQGAYPASSSTPSTSIYQPSVTHPPPNQAASWRPEGSSSIARDYGRGEPVGVQSYGESVKRHLDMYDFETALNEIADNSTIMLDFSRQYGARLHQTQRSGPLPGTLPAITEVDDLMNKSKHTMDALSKLREVLVAQQAVYYQQAQEQRMKTETDNKRNDSVHQTEDGKGGVFAGSDAKKRRGRAAAPGRCHSCNRAETPEWRRGPDGARTLCNACGLHYAKLTRKAGANKAAIGTSTLRPKSREREAAD